jgi:hypothetical protein
VWNPTWSQDHNESSLPQPPQVISRIGYLSSPESGEVNGPTNAELSATSVQQDEQLTFCHLEPHIYLFIYLSIYLFISRVGTYFACFVIVGPRVLQPRNSKSRALQVSQTSAASCRYNSGGYLISGRTFTFVVYDPLICSGNRHSRRAK